MQVNYKRLTKTATLPSYAEPGSQGLDLYADILSMNDTPANTALDATGEKLFFKLGSSLTIEPHGTVKIGTGFAFEPPEGYAGFIFARSGLSTKQGLRPANCVGLCDNSYQGEYIVALHNDTDSPKTIHHGDRIAQLLFFPIEKVTLVEKQSFKLSNRGQDGFGSTGV